MSGLTAMVGSSDEKTQDSDKLLNLYWNRAELKKEFAGMRKEQFRLQDRIKQQEGATARLQQKLDHLEDLLIDPDWVHNVVVFYQLRGLALRCERKLAKFAEQLKQQREQKQHNGILVRWNDERAEEARSVEQAALLKRDTVMQLEDQLESERHRLVNMSGFLKVFRRRSIAGILDDLATEIDTMRQDEAELLTRLTEVQNRKPPDNAGLNIPTKRSINIMIIAFSQQLYLQFADDDLAAMAKEATEKSVGAINYGDRVECNQLLNRINKRIDSMDQATDFAEVIQRRAKLIAASLAYREDTDAVPISASVATLFSFDENGVVAERDGNLVGENYWAVAKIFSR